MKTAPARITFILLCCYPVIALLSWLAEVVVPQWNAHSLLAAEGLRHIASHTTEALTHPVLIIVLLAALAIGCGTKSTDNHTTTGIKKGRIYRILAAELTVWLCLTVLIALVPNAPLRGIDGNIWTGLFPTVLPYIITLAALTLTTTWTCYLTCQLSWNGICSLWTDTMRDISPFIIPAMLLSHVVMCARYAFFG